MRAKKKAAAKCSVSIINSDGSKGISFVFKCFNLLFAILSESAQLFRIVNSISKITKSTYNGNGFLSYYFEFFFLFFSTCSFILSIKKLSLPPPPYSSHKFFQRKVATIFICARGFNLLYLVNVIKLMTEYVYLYKSYCYVYSPTHVCNVCMKCMWVDRKLCQHPGKCYRCQYLSP